MARCLVIGANGFLGSRLADALARTGHEVTGFDRYSRRIRAFESPDVVPLRGDFLDPRDVAAAVSGAEYVFHFLSTTTPASADREPTVDLRTNVSASVELLSLCVTAGVRRVFFASSGGAIYGPQPRRTFAEDAPALPVSPYGIGKLTIERYLDYYATTAGLDSVALRISNPYGPRATPAKGQGIIPITLDRLRRGEPAVQVGDGSMIRDYIHVDDLVARILRMVERAPRHRAYNLGSGRGHSVAEVLAAIRAVVGRDFEIVRAPQPATFVDHVVLDVARFRDEYGPARDLSLIEGIADTWTRMTTR
ncbi:NAD-dependent epimerase/dehydratase family protein [Microbacterium testaceum]|uniref:NAD-dependent epimerase/dehydratase family protein n=1 Tax=Microbacterium testaceum TaxID=2033 RepID=UPI001D1706A4|nr:NAD-dependent epimerase/dehydratase family protein [Microbacterium testaceum]MCC4247440.1 NAD-dependent epimerase/dehydratase family protein [Microbacterium testaceum]